MVKVIVPWIILFVVTGGDAFDYCPEVEHVFGTVTPAEKIPGNMDCKGTCDNLIQGGYMKFDLSMYKKGTQITQAKLSVYVLDFVPMQGCDYIYTWVCAIPMDPVTTSPQELHAAIEKHEQLISSYQILSDTGLSECTLKSEGVEAINRALSKDDNERWIAMSYTFE